MTRAKAAKICQSIKFLMDKEDYSEEVEEALDMAIEALEKEETLQNLTKPNKSDLIVKGAGEIKDGLYNIKDGKLFQYKANGGTVRTYPIVSADRPKWIPCSRRLPEEGDVVLICSKIGAIDFGKRKGDKWVWLAEALWDYWQETEDLIAWMPLPDAYKESDADGSD